MNLLRRIELRLPDADPALTEGLGIDVCMVVNEQRTGDWSQLFVSQRL